MIGDKPPGYFSLERAVTAIEDGHNDVVAAILVVVPAEGNPFDLSLHPSGKGWQVQAPPSVPEAKTPKETRRP